MMKKKAVLLIALVTLGFVLLGTIACTPQGTYESAEAEQDSATQISPAPKLQPVDHEGRFEQNGSTQCYTCHGASDAGNPTLGNSRAIPDDHYVDGTPDSRTLEPVRNQCITCHPVGGAEAE